MIILKILFLVSGVAFGLALVIPGYKFWSVIPLLSIFLCAIGRPYLTERYITSWKVRTNPQIVYWACSMGVWNHGWVGTIMGIGAKVESLALHLRNGIRFDIDLPPKDVEEILAWLKEENPPLRCGPYDGPDPTTPSEEKH